MKLPETEDDTIRILRFILCHTTDNAEIESLGIAIYAINLIKNMSTKLHAGLIAAKRENDRIEKLNSTVKIEMLR